jgi:hypothetical protein
MADEAVRLADHLRLLVGRDPAEDLVAGHDDALTVSRGEEQLVDLKLTLALGRHNLTDRQIDTDV